MCVCVVGAAARKRNCGVHESLWRRALQPLGWKEGVVCDLKFDSLLPEDHRANILSTADSLRHHCKLGGGSASIPGNQCIPRINVG